VGGARVLTPTSAPLAPPPAVAPMTAGSGGQRRADAIKPLLKGEEEENKWKWWYWILAGLCIGGFSIWQAYTQHQIKPLGELFLSVIAIFIGVWEFKRKRR
jgi:hypothetical protein